MSQPTHDDRKVALTAIIRIIETCWNIGIFLYQYFLLLLLGNFNAAVEILMGLKSEKLRPFWLSLRPEEKQQYEQVIIYNNKVKVRCSYAKLFFLPTKPCLLKPI